MDATPVDLLRNPEICRMSRRLERGNKSTRTTATKKTASPTFADDAVSDERSQMKNLGEQTKSSPYEPCEHRPEPSEQRMETVWIS